MQSRNHSMSLEDIVGELSSLERRMEEFVGDASTLGSTRPVGQSKVNDVNKVKLNLTLIKDQLALVKNADEETFRRMRGDLEKLIEEGNQLLK